MTTMTKKSIGSCFVNDNTAVTTITTVDTFVDLNLNALAAASSNIDGWTLTNTTTGELRYDGVDSFSGKCLATFCGTATGGGQEFNARLVKNGAALADAIESSVKLAASEMPIMLIVPVTAVTNDLFKLQVENVDGTTNIIVRFLSMEIS